MLCIRGTNLVLSIMRSRLRAHHTTEKTWNFQSRAVSGLVSNTRCGVILNSFYSRECRSVYNMFFIDDLSPLSVLDGNF